MRMPPEMFDVLLHRISPRIMKQHTSHARRTVAERRGLYMKGGRAAEGRRGRWQNGGERCRTQ